MQVKKIPMRMCCGCAEHFPKKELVRVVRSNDGEISIDLTGKKSGRGAYICKNIDCLARAVKTKRLERNLETKISDDIYTRLEEELKNNE